MTKRSEKMWTGKNILYMCLDEDENDQNPINRISYLENNLKASLDSMGKQIIRLSDKKNIHTHTYRFTHVPLVYSITIKYSIRF